jgi:hypothetical protein
MTQPGRAPDAAHHLNVIRPGDGLDQQGGHMRRTWLQIYEGFAIMLVLFTAMTNTMVIVGTAIVLLVIGLVAFPALRRTGTIAGSPALLLRWCLRRLSYGDNERELKCYRSTGQT